MRWLKKPERGEGIMIAFHEVSKESYASGGELMADKVK
jgi:phenylpyruvate tautomerase PptA (4-oxalocrotonate tautomerase family)